MLKDFTKLETFLVVCKERSFSKASAKIGISQPAVTQQIRYLEEYLDVKIIQRKKNGIRLTKEGQQLFDIVSKLDKCIKNAEKDILKIINKDILFVMSSSYVIGNYIIPTFLNNIKKEINNDIKLEVSYSKEAIEKLKNKVSDIALVEAPFFDNDIIYREWLDDEIVLVSNKRLPRKITSKHLTSYKWVCREQESHTRKVFKEYLDNFENGDVDCNDFDILTEVSSLTTIIQTILHANDDEQLISIVSKHAIGEYVKDGKLYEGRLPGLKMYRKLYIAYLKDRKHDAFIERVVDYLLSKVKIS